jgi:hypothetical protein
MNKEQGCNHKYTPNYANVWGSPSCEKCGKLMPDEEYE